LRTFLNANRFQLSASSATPPHLRPHQPSYSGSIKLTGVETTDRTALPMKKSLLLNPRRSTQALPPGLVILSIAKDLLFACCATVLLGNLVQAQTLARPGWAGSGLTPESWWRHAVLYRIDTPQLPTLAQLPSLQAFGIDAIVLTPESMQPPSTPGAPGPSQLGTGDSSATPDATEPTPDPPLTLDDLFFECSRLHIRVLVPLDLAAPNSTPDATLALAKSWLYRGAAGFVLSGIDQLIATNPGAPGLSRTETGDPAATSTPTASGPVRLHHRTTAIHLSPPVNEPAILASLRKLLTQFPGERILIGAAASESTPLPSLQLQIATLAASPDTAHLATLSAQTTPHTLLTLAPDTPFSPIEAAILLADNQPAILESSHLPADLLARVFPPLAKGTAPDAPAAPASPPPPPPPSDVYGAFKPYVRKDANTAAERKRKAAAEKAQQDAAQIATDTFPVQPMYQPITPTPEGQVAFYHRLIQLHRANATLHDGTLHALDTAGQPALAWAATHAGSAPLLVVCNPSSTPLKLDLTAPLQKLGQARDMARTLLHTAAASGVVNTDRLTVPPQGVYIGELERAYSYR
jgi:hypothetical protein